MIAHSRIRHIRQHQNYCKNHQKSRQPVRLSLEFRSFNPKRNQEKNNQRNARDHENRFPCREVVALHGKQISYHLNIREAERRYALCQNTSVDDSQKQPECADHRTHYCSSFYYVHKRQRGKHDQRIVEKHEISVYNERACVQKRMP